jgi:hypothetical protein
LRLCRRATCGLARRAATSSAAPVSNRFKSWDISLAKNNRLTERFNLQFRAEFFNAFNNVNFGQPNRLFNVSAPVFGSITTAGRPREIQFGLKLEF